MTLNSLQVTKCCKKYLFYLSFLFLKLFMDEPAMVLRYYNTTVAS